MNIKFSIIVPIYNAERYLIRCVESVLSQEYKNFEIILVDDGSKDNSAAICMEYEKAHDTVIYVSKENEGPAGARNAGILAADGKYILFLDSDDQMCEGLLSKLHAVIVSANEKDIYFGTFSSYYEDRNIIKPETLFYDLSIVEKGEPIEILEDLFLSNPSFFSVWRHAFKREFIIQNNILFDKSLFGPEDCDFIVKTILKCRHFGIADFSFCYYTIERQGSIMSDLTPKTVQSMFYMARRWFEYFLNIYETSHNISTKNIASRFANTYCDAIAFSGNLIPYERKKLCEFVIESDYILNYTIGKKHAIAKGIYRLYGFMVGSIIMKYLYRINFFLRTNLGHIWKSTYGS